MQTAGTTSLMVCLGAGGVGKTTVSAALAVRRACEGARVLCLTIDPARRLAESLGVPVKTTEVHRVPAAAWQAQGVECRGTLDVLMLDAKQTFDGLVARYAGSAEARQRIYDNRFYQYIASYLAGTQEYMAMEKLYEVQARGEWDVVVLDTPPTAHALDFLRAPERLVAALDSPAVRWLVQSASGGSKPWQVLGRGADVVLRALGRITGVGFLQQTAEFLATMSQLFGGFEQRAMKVASLLRSEGVTFFVVGTPERLAVRESQFVFDHLRQLGNSRMVMVFNRVVAELPALGNQLQDALPLPDGLTQEDAAALGEAVRKAYEDEQQQAAAQVPPMQQMERELEGLVPCERLPRLSAEVHDLRSLQQLATHLRCLEAA